MHYDVTLAVTSTVNLHDTSMPIIVFEMERPPSPSTLYSCSPLTSRELDKAWQVLGVAAQNVLSHIHSHQSSTYSFVYLSPPVSYITGGYWKVKEAKGVKFTSNINIKKTVVNINMCLCHFLVTLLR